MAVEFERYEEMPLADGAGDLIVPPRGAAADGKVEGWRHEKLLSGRLPRRQGAGNALSE